MVKHEKMLFALLVLFSMTAFLGANQVSSDTLSKISWQQTDDQIEVLIECPRNTPYDNFSLMNPNRLVIDLMGITQVTSAAMIEIDEMNILSVRSALNRPGVARVVFNFGDRVPLYRIEEKDNGLQVIFLENEAELSTLEPAREEKPAREKTEMVAETAQQKETVSRPDRVKISRPAATSSRSESRENAAPDTAKKKMAVGFSSGYSAFQDTAFKEAYGEGGVFFKGEFSFYLPGTTNNLDIWTGVSYFQKDGQLTFTKESIQLQMTTFSLAVRYLKSFDRFTPFGGIGIDYIVYKEILPEDFMVASTGGSHLGFHVQAGVYYDVLPALSFKAQLRYIWSKTTENDIEVNLGGIEYGLGIIYRFNL